MPTNIILTTLNSRYMHTAFGLRYLYANLGCLQSQTTIHEFTIQERPLDIVEKLLSQAPRIIGFSIYIWNVSEVSELIHIIKKISPEITIVLGGPEVSYSPIRVKLDDAASEELVSKEHYTLCRCGSSKNKPFCDGAHLKSGFKG